jgi:transcriptional regulator with PAS, ATPase and Fis domain
MGTFAMVAGAISATSSVLKMSAQMQAAEQQQNALEMQQKQRDLRYSQERLNVYDQVGKTLKHQTAQATVKGLAASSPSFNAIQRQTMNIGSTKFQNLETEKEMSEYNTKMEQENVKNTLWAQMFGDVGGMVSSFSQLKGFTENKP